ncbi:MAG: putative amidohydrolase [Paraglaciecola psychrophila]|jgi:predicted amidohydrolase
MAGKMVRLIIVWVVVSALLSCQNIDNRNVSIGIIHMAPIRASSLADITTNANTIVRAMTAAKANGAQWVMTPELALTGYKFKYSLGVDWIKPGADQWTQQLQRAADTLNMVLFLSHLEQDPVTLDRHNTLFVINRQGAIIARHRKINTLPGSESWSTPGRQATVASVDGLTVGLLICADAWPAQHAQSLSTQGADMLLSSANWAPGLYGPGDSWEQRVTETGLALVVNNRTGIEDKLDMREAKSVFVVPTVNGAARIFEHQSKHDAVIVLHYDRGEETIARQQVIEL